jgi:hypothetical protein
MTINTHKKDITVRFNFIRIHLIKEIFRYSDEKKKITGVPGNSFVYFDVPIDAGFYKVDRFGKGNFYFKEQVLPLSWSSINGSLLLKALNELKKNNVFVLKQIDNKFYKTRVKNAKK